MTLLGDAIDWLTDPANLGGPEGIWARLAEHLWYTALAVAIATLIAVPAGYLVGHTGRGRGVVVAVTGAARALPTLGVVTLLGLWLGIGLRAPLIALVVLAIPSILAGAYAGVQSVNRTTVDAARAVGMSEWQILRHAEIPLGLPLLIGGLRSATLQVVATATLAAYVGAGGLGRYLFLGLKTQDYPMMLGASLLVVALALALELAYEIAERRLRRGHAAARSPRRAPAAPPKLRRTT